MRVAFDSNVVSFFLTANQQGYDPAKDPDAKLAMERLAAFRLWIYGTLPVVVPTVVREVEAMPPDEKRQEHINWVYYHFDEVIERWIDGERRSRRRDELLTDHSGPGDIEDCLIVAECEQIAVDALATFDLDMIKHLKGHTPLFLDTPHECFERAAIPSGTAPRMILLPGHPLADATWWRW